MVLGLPVRPGPGQAIQNRVIIRGMYNTMTTEESVNNQGDWADVSIGSLLGRRSIQSLPEAFWFPPLIMAIGNRNGTERLQTNTHL